MEREESQWNNENKVDSHEEKKKRKRKKKFYKAIRDQMEFYFSDSNLNRDRFLSGLLLQCEDGFLDLEIFTKFNRIRALTTNLEEIANALTNSKILQLNAEKTKVKRIVPLKQRENVDECTIYVEHLPPNADHEWLKNIFTPFGQVMYVSLPKYKSNGRIKGFAFIEFDSPKAVQSACQHYGEFSEELYPLEFHPIASPTSEHTLHPAESEMYLDQTNLFKSENESSTHYTRKRPRSCEDAEEEKNVPCLKKLKDEDNEKETADLTERKKKKKRKKSKKNIFKVKQEADTILLRVLPKVHWKRLRNKYLALQRDNMAQLKRTLGLVVQEQQEMMSSEIKASPQLPSKLPQFIPGVIVQLVPYDHSRNFSDLKEDIRFVADVAYIDVKEGRDEVFIRFNNKESVTSFLNSKKIQHFGKFSLLEGTEEKDYWVKIHEDRDAKYKSTEKPKKRGREKILARAERILEKTNKHIRFDD